MTVGRDRRLAERGGKLEVELGAADAHELRPSNAEQVVQVAPLGGLAGDEDDVVGLRLVRGHRDLVALPVIQVDVQAPAASSAAGSSAPSCSRRGRAFGSVAVEDVFEVAEPAGKDERQRRQLAKELEGGRGSA